MCLNIFLSIFIFLLCFSVSYGQVSCVYRNNDTNGYTCDITIRNPYGLNNFASIGGTHISGKTNNDVLRVYRVSGSNSTNVPSIICDFFQSTATVNLEKIGIQSIDDKAFKNCKNLQLLYLGFNKITHIHEKAFFENSALQQLHIEYNNLTELSMNVFISQINLITLNLVFNEFSDFPLYIFKPLKNLTSLYLQFNKLKNLRVEWFVPLENLKLLSLRGNQIEDLPRNIFTSLISVKDINLESNKLKVIRSNAFRNLPNLTAVSFYDNQIESMDENFIDNTGVQGMYFRGNVCQSQSISDGSASRITLRMSLNQCFENFDYSLLGKVSKLETVNEGLQREILTLSKQITELHEENWQQQESIDNQAKKLEDLQNQIYELANRPCTCK